MLALYEKSVSKTDSADTMKLTVEEIREVLDLHKAGESKESRIITQLCQSELKRRIKGGRPRKSDVDRKEQNRIAQKNSRYRKKLREVLARRRK